jgi:hypothetical protein
MSGERRATLPEPDRTPPEFTHIKLEKPMTECLLEKARANRLKALAFLHKEIENTEIANIFDIDKARSQRKPTAVFYSSRVNGPALKRAA